MKPIVDSSLSLELAAFDAKVQDLHSSRFERGALGTPTGSSLCLAVTR